MTLSSIGYQKSNIVFSSKSQDLFTLENIEEILTPLKKIPENIDISRTTEDNHFEWFLLFDRMIQIEKNYSILCNSNEDRIYSIFSSFLQSMIFCGFDVTKQFSGQNEKPLHKAAETGCAILTLCLIEMKAPIDAYDALHETPLYKATKNSQDEIVDLLLKQGANVHTINKASCLELAIHVASCPKIIELLWTHGADLNATSPSPWKFTVLHWNAHSAKPDSIQTLLRHGMNDDKIDREGNTALDIAKKVQNGIYGITLLESKMRDENIQEKIYKMVQILEHHHTATIDHAPKKNQKLDKTSCKSKKVHFVDTLVVYKKGAI